MPRYLSGRTRTSDSDRLTDDRYDYLSLGDAEPNLGNPVSPGDVVPVGQQYQIISIEGYPGERYWVPRGGGILPGSISIFDEDVLVGGLSSTTQLNFTGSAIQAVGSNTGLPNPGIAVTISFVPPGNNGEVLFKDSGDFATSTGLTFDASEEYLGIGGSISVGADRSVFNAGTNNAGIASVGINTASPTYTLDINGDVRIRGTIVDFNGSEGTTSQLLTKNNFGGLTWIDSGALPSAAGGYYRTVQFHNNVGLVDGALEFVYNDVQGSVGIGSTIPKTGKRLDVLGDSLFTGNIEIVGVLTTTDLETTDLGVSGIATAQQLTVFGDAGFEDIDARHGAYTGIVTAAKFVGDIDVVDLFVTGIASFNNIGATGIITTNQLTVYDAANFQGNTTVERLNVTQFLDTQDFRATGISTLGSIKIENSTLSTTAGNIIINSGGGGILEVIDPLYVNNATQSTSSGTGSIITLGGVGIAKNLNVDGEVRLATNGGITTTGGDLYVDGDLFVTDDVFYDELNANRGEFVEFLQTDDLYVTGVSTFLDNVYMDSREIGISTFVDNKTVWNQRNTDGTTHDTSSVVSLSAASAFVWNNEDPSGINTTLTITGWWDDNAYIDNRSANGEIVFRTGFTEETPLTSIPDLLIDANGNIGIGTDNAADKLQVDGNILPTKDGTYNVGSPALRWNTIFATTLNGTLTGTADNSNNVLTTTSNSNSSLYLTFVDSDNSPGAFEQVFTDSDLSYNPFTNTLSGTNALFTNSFEVQGNSIFGNATTDTVSFTASLSSNLLPNTDGTRNLGSALVRYNEVHAIDFFGNISGTSSNANNVLTTEDTSNSDFHLTFVADNNTPTGDFEAVKTNADLTYNPGTGDLRTTGDIVSGKDSGGVSLTINDGYGNANIAFNHQNGIPEQNGNAARIQVNTDNNGNARMDFGVKSSVTAGVAVTPDYIMRIQDGVIQPFGDAAIDLGTASLRWNDVYAENFIGNVTGTTDSANEVLVTSSTTNAAHFITFVDSNNASPGDSEAVYSDTNLQYNPSTNTLETTNLLVTGDFDVNGTVDLGNAPTDTISFNGTVDTNILPTTDSTVDLGSNTVRWATIYADTFDGTFSGTADNANNILTAASNVNANFYLTFVDSNNSVAAFESVSTDANITYNPNTNTLATANLTVDTLLSVTGDVDLGDQTSDTVSINGRVDTNIIPSTDNTVDLGSSTLKYANVYATTFNGAFQGTADSANTVLTVTNNTDADFFLTFVDSNNSAPGQNEAVYTDSNIVYNPNDNALTIPNINVSTELSVSGNTTLGSDVSDSVIFNAGVQSILPFADSAYDIGSSTERFATIYADTFNGTFQGTADAALQVRTTSNATNGTFYPTFVDSNNAAPGTVENVYTDGGITYNPDSNLLTISNVQVTTNLESRGNTTFGNNANNDNVYFIARVDSNIRPQTDDTYDLGSASRRWGNVYATQFNGSFVGTADNADKIAVADNSDDSTFNLVFVDQSADSYKSIYQDTGIVYNPSTNLLTATNLTVSTAANLNGNTNLGNASSDSIAFNGTVSTDILPDGDLTRNLGGASARWNNVYANTFNGTFQGTAASASQVLVTDDATDTNYAVLFATGGNTSPGNQRSVFSDADITYNPSSNTLTTSNITSIGTLTAQGDATIGQSNTETLTVNAVIGSSLIADTDSSRDLGSAAVKWDTVYANSFNGTFTGTADTAEELLIGTIATDADFFLTFVDSANSPAAAETVYSDAEIKYNPFTNTLTTTNITLSNDLVVDGNTDIGDDAGDTLTVNASVDSNIIPNIDGTHNLGSPTIKWGTVYADNFSGTITGSVGSADQVLTGSNGTDADLFITFVLDNNAANNRQAEDLYTDDGLKYNPTSDLLTLKNLTVEQVVTLGDNATDALNFNGSANTNFVPLTDLAHNLGSSSFRWNTVYAQTFDGVFQGTADSADLVATIAEAAGGDRYLTFVDSNNSTADYEALKTNGSLKYVPNTGTLEVGTVSATTSVIVDDGNGSVALTTNDGGGNANITFNHANITPDKTGNAARIAVNVDSTTNPTMEFEVAANLAGGTQQNTTPIAQIQSTGFHPSTDGTYDLGTASLVWENLYVNNINGVSQGGGGGTGDTFDAGTRLAFQNSSAPTGWTVDTTYNNYAIRLRDGTGTLGSRTNGIAFTAAFANRTVVLPRHSHSGTSDNAGTNHTHTGNTSNQSSNHTHGGTTGNDSPDHAHNVGNFPNQSVERGNRNSRAARNARSTRATTGATARHQHGFSTGGISSNHSHSFTTSGQNQNHTHTFDSSFEGTTGAAMDFRVNYVDFIIAEKS